MTARMTLSEYKTDPALLELIEKAVARYNAMSPEERREHDIQQKISWIYGEIGIENPDDPRTKEDIRRHLEERGLL